MLFPRQFSFRPLYFNESHFPKENFKNTKSFASVMVIESHRGLPSHRSFPGSWHPPCQEGFVDKGQSSSGGRRPASHLHAATYNSAEQHQHKAHSSTFDIRPFSFEKFFELGEIKQNKTTEKNKEPGVTLSKLQIGNLIHLPAHRHTHLACLYLYAGTQALCSVEAFWVFLNQQEIKNHCASRRYDGKIPPGLSCDRSGYRSLETAALLTTSSKTESQNR